MSQKDVDALNVKLKTVAAKPRARYRDWGTKRDSRKSKGLKEPGTSSSKKVKEAGTAARKRKQTSTVPAASQLPPMPKGKEVLDDTDTGESDPETPSDLGN